MRKILFLACTILLISGCSLQIKKIDEHTQQQENLTQEQQENLNQDQEDDYISDKEKEFNDSGQAKAIEDETDLWMVYQDEDAGFSIKYPHNVSFDDKNSDGLFQLSIGADKIDTLEGPLGFNKETALANSKALKDNEYGEEVDWPLKESKKVISLGDNNAQEFMVVSRFEVCDVTFKRKLYFFNNDYQIIISLSGPKEQIVETMSDYFTTDSDNCGEQIIWDFARQGDFYQALTDNKGSEFAQEWFDTFTKIIKTIEFIEN